MITYEVTASIELSIAGRYEQYMKTKHLKEVLASGCFAEAILEQAGQGKYRARYVARSQDDLDRYLREHTAALRKDFTEHFPTGVLLSREVWVQVAAEKALDV